MRGGKQAGRDSEAKQSMAWNFTLTTSSARQGQPAGSAEEQRPPLLAVHLERCSHDATRDGPRIKDEAARRAESKARKRFHQTSVTKATASSAAAVMGLIAAQTARCCCQLLWCLAVAQHCSLSLLLCRLGCHLCVGLDAIYASAWCLLN